MGQSLAFYYPFYNQINYGEENYIMSKRAIMFLGIEDPAEHLPLSKETFAHIFEWAVTNIKENADGTVSAFLNIKDI